MSRTLLLLGMAIALAACEDPKRMRPFVVPATPELRATFVKACSDRTSHIQTERVDPAGDFAYVQSQGAKCGVRMYYDPRTLEIIDILVGTAHDWTWFRTFTEEVVLPMVKPHIRAYIEQHVLADLGATKTIEYARRGKGNIHYRNRTWASTDENLKPYWAPSLDLTVGPR